MKMTTVAAACVVAGLAVGGGALVMSGDDDTPAIRSGELAGAGRVERAGHILVFLVDGVSDDDRQGIEAALDAEDDVAAHEHLSAAATRAEAPRLLSANPEVFANIAESSHSPESYLVDLGDPNRPNATSVSSQLAELPGVFAVAITDVVPEAEE